MLLSTSSCLLLHKEAVTLVLRDGLINVVNTKTGESVLVNHSFPVNLHILPCTERTGEFAVVGLSSIPILVHCSNRELIGLSALLLAFNTEARQMKISKMSKCEEGRGQEDGFSGSCVFLASSVPESEIHAGFHLEAVRLQSLKRFFHVHSRDLHEEAFELLLEKDLGAFCLDLAQCGLYAVESTVYSVQSGVAFPCKGNLDFKHLLANPEVELNRFSKGSMGNISLAESCANDVLYDLPRTVLGQPKQLATICPYTNSIATFCNATCHIFCLSPTSYSRMRLWMSFPVRVEQSEVLDLALGCMPNQTAFEVELNRRGEKCVIESSMSEGDLVFLLPRNALGLGKLGRVISRPSRELYLVQLGAAPLLEESALVTPRNTVTSASLTDNDYATNLPIYYPCAHVLPVTETRDLEEDLFHVTAVMLTAFGAAVYERQWENGKSWRMFQTRYWNKPGLKRVWFYSETACLLANATEVYLWDNLSLGLPPSKAWKTFATAGDTCFAKSEKYLVLGHGSMLLVMDSSGSRVVLEREFDREIASIAIELQDRIRVLFQPKCGNGESGENENMLVVHITQPVYEEEDVSNFQGILDAINLQRLRFGARLLGTNEWLESNRNGELLLPSKQGVWEFCPTLFAPSSFAVFGEIELYSLVANEVVIEGETIPLPALTSTRVSLKQPSERLRMDVQGNGEGCLVRLTGRLSGRNELALRSICSTKEFQVQIWQAVTDPATTITTAALRLLNCTFDKSTLSHNMLEEFVMRQFVSGVGCEQAVEFIESLEGVAEGWVVEVVLHVLTSRAFQCKQGLEALLGMIKKKQQQVSYSSLLSLLVDSSKRLFERQTWQTRVLREVFGCEFDPFASQLSSLRMDAAEELDIASSTPGKRLAICVHSFSPGSSTTFVKSLGNNEDGNGEKNAVEICFQDVLKLNTTQAVVWSLPHTCDLTWLNIAVSLCGGEDSDSFPLITTEYVFVCTVETFSASPATWTGEKMAYTGVDLCGVEFDIDMCTLDGAFSFDRNGVIGAKSTFPTIVPRGVGITSGRWYYEVLVLTANNGVGQIGFCDSLYVVNDKQAEGVGDCDHSWAVDGTRTQKWNRTNTEWGKRWKDGDVVGCAVDIDEGKVYFSLNGSWKRPLGLAFHNCKFAGGVFPAVTGERGFKYKMNFGQQAFAHHPPSLPGFKSVFDWMVANRELNNGGSGSDTGTSNIGLWARESFTGSQASISCQVPVRAKYVRISLTALTYAKASGEYGELNLHRKRVTAKLAVGLRGSLVPPSRAHVSQQELQLLGNALVGYRRGLSAALESFFAFNQALPAKVRWTRQDTAKISKAGALDKLSNDLPNRYVLQIVDLLAKVGSTIEQMSSAPIAASQHDEPLEEQYRVVVQHVCDLLLSSPAPPPWLAPELKQSAAASLFRHLCIDQVAWNRPQAGQVIKLLLQSEEKLALDLLLQLAMATTGNEQDLLQVLLPAHLSGLGFEQVVSQLLSKAHLLPLCCQVFDRLASTVGEGGLDTSRMVGQVLTAMSAAGADVQSGLKVLRHLRDVSSSSDFLLDLAKDLRFSNLFRGQLGVSYTLERFMALELLDNKALPELHHGEDYSPELTLLLLQQQPRIADPVLLANVFAQDVSSSLVVATNWALALRVLCRSPALVAAFPPPLLRQCLLVRNPGLCVVFAKDLMTWLRAVGPTHEYLQVLAEIDYAQSNERLCGKALELYLDIGSDRSLGDEFDGLALKWMEQMCAGLNTVARFDGLALLVCVHLFDRKPVLTMQISTASFLVLTEWLCVKHQPSTHQRRVTAGLFRLFQLACNSPELVSAVAETLTRPCPFSAVLLSFAKQLVGLQSLETAQFACGRLIASSTAQPLSPTTIGTEVLLEVSQGLPLFPLTVDGGQQPVLLRLANPATLTRIQLDFNADARNLECVVEAGLNSSVLISCGGEGQALSGKHCSVDLAALPCNTVQLVVKASSTADAMVVDWFFPDDQITKGDGGNSYPKSELATRQAGEEAATSLLGLQLFGHALPTIANDSQLPLALEASVVELLVGYLDAFPALVLPDRAQQVVFPLESTTRRQLAWGMAKSDHQFASRALEYCLQRYDYPQCLALAVQLGVTNPEAFSRKACDELSTHVLLADGLYPPSLSLVWLVQGWKLILLGSQRHLPSQGEEDDNKGSFQVVWAALGKCVADSALECALGELVCALVSRNPQALRQATLLEVDFSQRRFGFLATSCNQMLDHMLPNICAQTIDKEVTLHVFELFAWVAKARGRLFSKWFNESGWLVKSLQTLQVGRLDAKLKRAVLDVILLVCHHNSANQTLVATALLEPGQMDLLVEASGFENLVRVQVFDLQQEIERISQLVPNPDRFVGRNQPIVQPQSLSSSLFRLSQAHCGKMIEVTNAGLVATQTGHERWGMVRTDRELAPFGQSVWEVRLDHSPKGHIFVGLATEKANVDAYLGCDRQSYGYIGNRGAWHNKRKEMYGKEFKTGDVVKVIVDMSEGKVTYCVNGESLGEAFTGLAGQRLFPAVALFQKGDKVSILYNTHVTHFQHPISFSSSIAAVDCTLPLLQDASEMAWRRGTGVGGTFWVKGNTVTVAKALDAIGRGCILDKLRSETGREEMNRAIAGKWEIELDTSIELSLEPTTTLSELVRKFGLDALECSVHKVCV
ncbi:hypothetical protein BASA81_003394 [Batrachochytrium salamandrivorans]|nr:hypothetical protein BASA81_003394 [Batrachochytrium salamandrivorans]